MKYTILIAALFASLSIAVCGERPLKINADQTLASSNGDFLSANDVAVTPYAYSVGESHAQAFIFEGDSNMTVNGAWPVKGAAYLAEWGTDVENVAEGGAELVDIIADYATEVYPERPAANGGRPAWLTVSIGTNGYAADPIADMIDDWDSYMDTAAADGFKLVACTVPRRMDFTIAPWLELVRQQFNAHIRQSVDKYQILLDLDAMFPDPKNTDFFYDSVHFTALATDMIGRNWAAIMLAPPPTRIDQYVAPNKVQAISFTSFNAYEVNLAVGSTVRIAASGATGTTALTFLNQRENTLYTFVITQGATARNITWPAGTTQPQGGGTTWTPSGASKVDVVTAIWDGLVWRILGTSPDHG